MDQLLKRSIAEFVGTFVILFIGCGTAMVGDRLPGTVASGVVPIVFGLAVATMIYSVGHISGAHFNPAVTLAFAVGRHFPRRDLIGYWLAQFGGALAAMAVLTAILPPGGTYCAATLKVGLGPGLAWEALLSFVLMFVIVSVATDTRAVGTLAGVAIGSAVTMTAFVGGPMTGAAINPARYLAPALFAGDLTNLWVYLLGPALGTCSAALLYGWIRK